MWSWRPPPPPDSPHINSCQQVHLLHLKNFCRAYHISQLLRKVVSDLAVIWHSKLHQNVAPYRWGPISIINMGKGFPNLCSYGDLVSSKLGITYSETKLKIPGFSHQCLTIELWQLDNHYPQQYCSGIVLSDKHHPPQSSICVYVLQSQIEDCRQRWLSVSRRSVVEQWPLKPSVLGSHDCRLFSVLAQWHQNVFLFQLR